LSETIAIQEKITLTKKERLFGAIQQQPLDRPPVWLMRQAGRYMPAYQEVKKHYTFHEMCAISNVAADVSLQPYSQFGMDAIIVFNDILIPLQHIGLSVEFTDRGPAVIPPVRSEADAKKLHNAVFDETPPVYESISEIRRRVGEDVPIFGFAGSPFTMAAYMVEGSMSKNLEHIKTMVYSQPALLESLLDLITETVVDYLKIQIKAGADVVQIFDTWVFDTWAGALSQTDYRRFALPYQKRIVDAIQQEGTPVVLYVNGSTPYLTEMKESGANVLSVDWRVDLKTVREHTGDTVALQGNLDPTALYASPEQVSRKAKEILANHANNTGLIFNLGHGILPGTPVECVQALVETVQGYEYSGNS